MQDVVIARAFGGQPLKRVVISHRNGRYYVANPESLQAIEKGYTSPVGFPEEDVFVFDEKRFQVLEAAWRICGNLKREEWSGLKRYNGA